MSDPFTNAMKSTASDLEGVMPHLCKKGFSAISLKLKGCDFTVNPLFLSSKTVKSVHLLDPL